MATIYQNGIQYSGSGEPLIYDDMGGATSTTGGVHGLVPAPSAGDNEKFLSGDGSWKSAGEYITKTISGNPIEISDSASAPLVKCVSAITGSQDLHGYDKPWVGGAGKNKFGGEFGASYKYTIPSGATQMTFSTKSNGSYKLSVRTYDANNTKTGTDYTVIDVGSTTGSVTATLPNDAVTFILFISGGGSATDFSEVQAEVGSTATSYEPYSNICPITAYTEGEIEVRGKNIGEISASSMSTSNHSTLTYQDAGVVVSTTGAYSRVRYKYKVVKGETYTVSYKASATDTGARIYYTNEDSWGQAYGQETLTQTETTYSKTFTADAEYFYFIISAKTSNTSGSETVKDFQIESGSTATAYEPYTSTTHTTTYPSAIYRGSADYVGGEVTEEWATVVLDGSNDEDWKYNSTNAVAYISLPNCLVAGSPIPQGVYTANNLFMDVRWSDKTDAGSVGLYYNSPSAFIKYSQITSVADVRAFLATNPMQLAYKVATPTTSSVTPTNLPIKSLSGYNHIESSTGDMEVEYITEEYQPLVDLIADGGGTSSDDYITEETLIGSWLGTPLYRRVIEISGNKASGGYYTLLNDSTINLIKYEGCVQNQYWTGAGCMLNSYYSESQYCGCAYSSNDGARIDWYNNLGMTISKIYLIIYYTKK